MMKTRSIHYLETGSPLGKLILAATERGLCGLYFTEHKYFSGPQAWARNDEQPYLRMADKQLAEYFAGERTRFDVPLDLSGTAFQVSVWEALQQLPYGETTNYGEIAQRVARPDAIRATGTAIGRNPVSIIVPCHRVLGASGALSGYAGGLERKRYLLAQERKYPA